jgi:putative redox protein
MSSDTKVNRVSAVLDNIEYITRISAANHLIIADEPITAGGADLGPEPHDLLLAALASCTCITVKMYAKRKGWPLTAVNCICVLERGIQNGSYINRIQQSLSFSGSLDEKMTQRLMEIVGKCPVHKTLSGEIKINTELKHP